MTTSINIQQEASTTDYVCLHLVDYCHSAGPTSSEHPDCLICHEPISPNGATITHTGTCGSCYHEDCLITWFAGPSNRCPNCRTDITRLRDPVVVEVVDHRPTANVVARVISGTVSDEACLRMARDVVRVVPLMESNNGINLIRGRTCWLRIGRQNGSVDNQVSGSKDG